MVAASGVSASSLPRLQRIPPLSQWRRCDAFREASNLPTDQEKLTYIIKESIYYAGLLYTLAVLELAEQCQFAQGTFASDEFLEKSIKNVLESFDYRDERYSNARLQPYLRVDLLYKNYLYQAKKEDISLFIDEIKGQMGQKKPMGETIAYILREGRARATQAVELLIGQKGAVIPLTVKIPGMSLAAFASHDSAQDLMAVSHPAEFDFSQAGPDSNICKMLEGLGQLRTEFVQSILVSYGLGYALLIAHRIDQCAHPSHLVQELHNDLYKWIKEKLQRSGLTVKLNQEIFTALRLSSPSDFDFDKQYTAIELTHIIEKTSMDQVKSIMARKE